MNIILSLLVYIIIVCISVFIVDNRFKMAMIQSEDRTKGSNVARTLWMIVFVTLLFTLYNVMVTKMNPSFSGDRRIYALNFYGKRTTPSIGLSYVIGLIRRFSSNVELLFYFSTFVTMLITLVAYIICRDATPKALLFLLSTQYVFFTIECLKQSYTNALAALCICLALRSKGKLNTILSCLAIVIAIGFHHTGYILIPIYILLRVKKTRKSIPWLFLMMAVIIVFFEPILSRVASLIMPYASTFAMKINEYIGENAREGLRTEGYLASIKGVPFYAITLVGVIKRKQLVQKIENYDNYLFLAGILTIIYLATIYNAWVYRLSYFFYLPMGVFYTHLSNNIEEPKNKVCFNIVTIGLAALLTMRFVVLMYWNYGGF